MRALRSTVLSLALLAGCANGKGLVQVTVGATGIVRGVDHLEVTATVGGVTSRPDEFPLTGRPVDIPPEQTFTLIFDPNRQGPLIVTVDARDASNATLAQAHGTGRVDPGKLSSITVTLPGTAIADMGTPDFAQPPDMGPPVDLAPRLVPPPAAWISSGGGAARGTNSIGLTLSAGPVAGSATGSAGGSLQSGVFPTLTY